MKRRDVAFRLRASQMHSRARGGRVKILTTSPEKSAAILFAV